MCGGGGGGVVVLPYLWRGGKSLTIGRSTVDGRGGRAHMTGLTYSGGLT